MKIVHVQTHSIEPYNLTPDSYSNYRSYVHMYAKMSNELGYKSIVKYLTISSKKKRISKHKYGHIMIGYTVTINKGHFGYEISYDMLLDLIREDNVIVHIHNYYSIMYDIIALAKRLSSKKIKIVAHYHSPCEILEPFKSIKRITLQQADKIIAINRAELKRLVTYWKIPKEKVALIPNMVDTEFFRPINNKKSDNVVLYVGNIVYRKGVHILLRAFLKCQRRIKDLKLIFVGNGPLRPYLEKYIKTKNLSNNVKFLGRVSDDDLLRLYNEASVTVLPSIQQETFGLVLIESMACGTPVIATATEGPKDIVSHEVDGFLAPVGDVDKLAEAVCTIIGNPDLREQMSKNARKKVERRFSWNVVKERLKEAYASLAEQS